MTRSFIALCSLIGSLAWAQSAVLPRPDLTPGEVDPAVTAAMLRNPAFIKARRHVRESEKKEIFRLYGVPWSERAKYEVDHYVPLCLGGKNSRGNLWLEPWNGQFGAHTKDRLEIFLHRRVNKGQMSLSQAQAEFLNGPWTNALAKYGIAPSGLRNTVFKVTHKAVK